MKSSINWFEIPTRDMDKAVAFYEQTLGLTLKREVFSGGPMAIFPVDDMATGVTGAIVANGPFAPGSSGVVVYLEAADGVQACLKRAKAAGATEAVPHTAIGEHGWIAVVRDPEGNLLGLHSMTKP
jgi:uncharacterized protein